MSSRSFHGSRLTLIDGKVGIFQSRRMRMSSIELLICKQFLNYHLNFIELFRYRRMMGADGGATVGDITSKFNSKPSVLISYRASTFFRLPRL
jgi:hypothetical protein